MFGSKSAKNLGMIAVAVLLLAIAVTNASASGPVFVPDYLSWPDEIRLAYVAGAVDMTLGFLSAQKSEKAYMCLAKMSYQQVAGFLSQYLTDHREARDLPVTLVLLKVVGNACGGL